MMNALMARGQVSPAAAARQGMAAPVAQAPAAVSPDLAFLQRRPLESERAFQARMMPFNSRLEPVKDRYADQIQKPVSMWTPADLARFQGSPEFLSVVEQMRPIMSLGQ